MTEIREATPGEYATVRSICNGAMLDVPAGMLRRSSVLVATDDDRVLGALVLSGTEIEAIAVRPGRRGQEIGTTLVDAAGRRRPLLTAGFDPGVRPFYTALGFDISCSDGRCRGERTARSGSL